MECFETMEGKVLKGGQRGKLLMGVPARVDANPYGLQDGIYVGKAKVNEMDKKYRKAIISISSHDLSGKHKRTVSVYISSLFSDFYEIHEYSYFKLMKNNNNMTLNFNFVMQWMLI